MSLGEASEWILHAKCRNMADALFPEGKDQKKVRGICMSCPVRLECLAEALDNRVEWGIWGGNDRAGSAGSCSAPALTSPRGGKCC